MRRSQAVLSAVLASATLATAGCAEREACVADQIRAANSPIVREVVYRSSNILDPAEVDVYVSLGTTNAQAQALWCDVIVLYKAGGLFSVRVDPTCPAASS
jgi:hypothetical protein